MISDKPIRRPLDVIALLNTEGPAFQSEWV